MPNNVRHIYLKSIFTLDVTVTYLEEQYLATSETIKAREVITYTII